MNSKKKTEEWEGWEEVTAVHNIHLAPHHLAPDGALERGVLEYLSTYLHHYDPLLRIVPLAYSKVDWSLAGPLGQVIGDSPQVHFRVRVRWTGFSPTPGVQINGMVDRLDGAGLAVELLSLDESGPRLLAIIPAVELKKAGWEWTDDFGGYDGYGNGGKWVGKGVPEKGTRMTVIVTGPGTLPGTNISCINAKLE